MNAPSPGILASAIRNEFYDTQLKYLEALGEALRIEYETIVNAGFVLQVDAPDLALERHVTYRDQPVSAFIAFVEDVITVINRALRNVPRERVRLHVCWGNSSRRTTRTCPCLRSCQQSKWQRSEGSFCRSRTAATLMNTAVSRSRR